MHPEQLCRSQVPTHPRELLADVWQWNFPLTSGGAWRMCKVQSLTPEWDWPKGMVGENAACLLSDPSGEDSPGCPTSEGRMLSPPLRAAVGPRKRQVRLSGERENWVDGSFWPPRLTLGRVTSKPMPGQPLDNRMNCAHFTDVNTEVQGEVSRPRGLCSV